MTGCAHTHRVSVGDPYVELVAHSTSKFSDRHTPAVVAQVALVFWSQRRDVLGDLDDPALVEAIGRVLARMPASKQ